MASVQADSLLFRDIDHFVEIIKKYCVDVFPANEKLKAKLPVAVEEYIKKNYTILIKF